MQPTDGCRIRLILPKVLAVIAIAFAGLFHLANAQAPAPQGKQSITSMVAESTALPASNQTPSDSQFWDIVTVLVMSGLAILALILAPARQYPVPQRTNVRRGSHKRYERNDYGSGPVYVGGHPAGAILSCAPVFGRVTRDRKPSPHA